MDKNSILGFVLLGLLFFGYFYFTRQGQLSYEKKQQHIADSINRLKPKTDSAIKTVQIDSALIRQREIVPGVLQDSAAKEDFYQIETKVFRLTFTNKGGQPYKVELKDYKTFDGKPLYIEDGDGSSFSYQFNTGSNSTALTADLFFSRLPDQQTKDGDKVITYEVKTPSGSTIEHQYIVRQDNYMIDFNIRLVNAPGLFTDDIMRFNWVARATQKEHDLDWEIQQSHVSFVENDDYDFEHLSPGKKDDKTFKQPVDWIAINQQFFVNSVVAKNKFESGTLNWETPKDTSLHLVGIANATMQLKVPATPDAVIPMQLYYGPSDYNILKSYGNKMFNMVPLGTGIYAFVKYINRGFVLPVFDFLAKYIRSYGVIIALMTILIRLLISPLTYQSYLSGAKMKLLRPELEQLKAKLGDDKQAYAMEQMKLYRSAGANPMGGCIPALFQIPIFFALYSFFNSNIALRGESFWWAKDLSSYDSIVNFSFNIPFYGSHVSLFTILAVITSLAISIYGMTNMQDTGNPMMKYIPYIFPIFLLGIFNRMPAALTWYYTVSNVITLLIQFVIQTYIIDHEKLMAKLQANKKKAPKRSKWQEKIDAMQQQNEKLKQMRQRVDSNRKK